MKTWETTNIIEQEAIKESGEEFLAKHKTHVESLIKDCKYSVAPSGSDLFKPELWKGIHWNWYLENFNIVLDKNVSLWDKISSIF